MTRTETSAGVLNGPRLVDVTSVQKVPVSTPENVRSDSRCGFGLSIGLMPLSRRLACLAFDPCSGAGPVDLCLPA